MKAVSAFVYNDTLILFSVLNVLIYFIVWPIVLSIMAHCMRLEDLTDYVRDKIVNEKWSHLQLSEYLQARYPGLRG